MGVEPETLEVLSRVWIRSRGAVAAVDEAVSRMDAVRKVVERNEGADDDEGFKVEAEIEGRLVGKHLRHNSFVLLDSTMSDRRPSANTRTCGRMRSTLSFRLRCVPLMDCRIPERTEQGSLIWTYVAQLQSRYDSSSSSSR